MEVAANVDEQLEVVGKKTWKVIAIRQETAVVAVRVDLLIHVSHFLRLINIGAGCGRTDCDTTNSDSTA